MAKILELNLIKTKIKVIETRRQYSRYSRIIYFVAICVFLGISLNFYSLTNKISRAKKELAGIESVISQKRQMYGMEDMERSWLDRCRRLNSVYSLVSSRSAWAAKLKEFGNLLPQGMCIRTVEVSMDQKNKVFSIELLMLPDEMNGFKEVENYISSLENDKYIGKGVKLETHERRRLNRSDVEAFKIVIPQGDQKK
jgi:Tfp pilus assembly protein PilN